jgi:hypothetical protein
MMNKINTTQGEWTIVKTDILRSYTDFAEVMAWANNSFGPNADDLIEGSCSRWCYLNLGKFGFLFEEDAVMFALRWA